MFNRITLFCLLPAVVVALPGGQSETIKLTGEVGKNLTVDIGLQVDDHVVLFSGPDRRVLFNYDNGTLLSNELGFHLDIKSGSIIISSLNLNHSGEFHLQITHRNNVVDNYKYEINVTKADPIKSTAESSQDTSTDQKNYLAVGLSVFAVVVCVAVLVLYGVRSGRIRGNCCSSAASTDKCGHNGVV